MDGVARFGQIARQLRKAACKIDIRNVTSLLALAPKIQAVFFHEPVEEVGRERLGAVFPSRRAAVDLAVGIVGQVHVVAVVVDHRGLANVFVGNLEHDALVFGRIEREDAIRLQDQAVAEGTAQLLQI